MQRADPLRASAKFYPTVRGNPQPAISNPQLV
jgi:hypothetical protein